MKKVLRIATVLICLFLQSQLFANTVIVKGTVKDSANNPVANRTVKIYSTDSSNNGCILSHTVVTNPNGFYIDTLTCNGDIRKLAIIVESCNGLKITNYPTVFSTPNQVESNFIICGPLNTTPVSCKAAFSYTSAATGIKFNAAGCSTISGDTIISRTWTFGDSTPAMTGNIVDPTHLYSKPGVYNACLIITTKRGCQSSYCQTVAFTPSTNACSVQAMITTERVAPKQIRFNSSQSTTALGDSIFQRIWNFGDGTSLDGNQINPLKVYKDTGVYNVCVSVRTVKGCEKQYCISISVRDSIPGTSPVPTSCKAFFTYTFKDSTVQFNSADSKASATQGDSIISRTWYFSDGSTGISQSGNIIDPSHKFSKPGTYNVYLVIKTKLGCESKYTLVIVIPAPVIPTGCKAVFTYTIKDSTIYFKSGDSKPSTISGDSIISRTWYFIDSTHNLTLGGNVIDTSMSIRNILPGTYNVYLVIKTKYGCESKFVLGVVVPKPVTPTNCKAVFTYAIKDSTIYFRSGDSKPSTVAGDSIISRIWYFVDSTHNLTLGGNIIDTSISIRNILPGTYNVYLVIKTKYGCESKFVLGVVVPKPVIPINCKAVFNYSIKDSVINFNSAASQASSTRGDSIISRTWSYTDSTHNLVLNGNVVDTSFSLRGMNIKPGSYNVNLVIKTKFGCSSKYTLAIVIPKPVIPTNCKAVFDYTIKDSTIQFCSCDSKASSMAGDSIISRTWSYTDSTHNYILTGNVSDTAISLRNTNIKPGTYYVTLVIKTKYGCESKVTIPVVIPKPYYDLDCKAYFTYSIKDSVITFNSTGSFASSTTGDSIVARTWAYTDSTHNYVLNGNVVDTSISLRNMNIKPGTYYVTLSIKTKYGCESKIKNAIVIAGPVVPIACKAAFTYTAQGRTVTFNSSSAKASTVTDSIVSRIWLFGDNTIALQGNTISPVHNYSKPGKYTVLLYIKTKSGCESNISATFTLLPEDCPQNIQYTTTISQKKVTFSSQIIAGAGDSIMQRIWNFGDNSSLAGNQLKTEKEYCFFGTYNTCLQIKTVYGCEAKVCKEITISDTTTKPQSVVDYVKIISINPNPVVTRMITTIYSRNSNTDAEIAIYDAYGNRRLTLKKTLLSGNNMIEIATEFLPHGPYYLKVSAQKGIDSKLFYKL